MSLPLGLIYNPFGFLVKQGQKTHQEVAGGYVCPS
jgi:hypothetical protein